MANEIGGSLIIVCQIALLVGNYVYKWNLPWYYLWLPLLISVVLLVIGVIIFIIILVVKSL